MKYEKKETIGLLVTMKAKAGKAEHVKNFLYNGLPLALKESETISWFAFQIDENSFGIYDTFEAETGRQAHLTGDIAKALLSVADTLLEDFNAEEDIKPLSIITHNHKSGTHQKGLLVIMKAKTGEYNTVEQFLKTGEQLVDNELETLSWYAFKLDPTTFGIFDTFEKDTGRDTHLNGEVANALMKNAPKMLKDFTTEAIQKLNILAAK